MTTFQADSQEWAEAIDALSAMYMEVFEESIDRMEMDEAQKGEVDRLIRLATSAKVSMDMNLIAMIREVTGLNYTYPDEDQGEAGAES